MIQNKSKSIEIPEVKYDSNTHRFILKMISEELSNMSTPCYYPKLVRSFEDVKERLGIRKKDCLDFKINNYNKKISSFDMMNQEQVIVLSICLIYFARKKDFEALKVFYYFLAIKFYYNLFHKHFKFCNDKYYELALNRISKKHLFKIKKGIPNAIVYLADEERKKYEKILGDPRFDIEMLVKLLYALRMRISQSLKSFAESYYRVQQEEVTKKGSRESDSPPQTASTGIDRVESSFMALDKISAMICTYSHIDEDCLEYAITKSGIRRSTGNDIIKEVSQVENKENVYFIYVLIYKMLNNKIKDLCNERGRIQLIAMIDSGKKILDKYSIKEEMIKLVNSLPSSYIFKNIYERQIIIFLSHYFTLYLKRRIC